MMGFAAGRNMATSLSQKARGARHLQDRARRLQSLPFPTAARITGITTAHAGEVTAGSS
jgi:hypothetical protein